MKKTKLVILFLLLSINLMAQDWYKGRGDQAKLVGKITSNESWDSIYHFAKNELKIPKETLADISKTIEFQTDKTGSTIVDKFFHTICDSIYTDFPYRRSGYLSNDLYEIILPDTSEFGKILSRFEGKSIYSESAEILQIDLKILLPQLEKHLQNEALTRLCVRPFDWGDRPYCLSVSDVAMEMIELKTYCDFFDNASQYELLFSNLEISDRNEIIKNVNDWYAATDFQTTTESIVYFLDKFTDLGHSYTYTCYNLKFLGDSTLAMAKLNERDSVMNCGMKLANYPFWDVSYEDCIKIMLERDNYLYKDRDLSTVINDDLTRPPLATRTDYWDDWHIILAALVNYDKDDIPKTLIALMQIEEIVTTSEIPNKEKWEIQYPLQYHNNFRVCDFAFLKYDELIKHIEVKNWLNIGQRDSLIQKLAAEYED